MNIQQIQYVLSVGELRNFGKAADKCFISQSTLSTMIGKLESEIGITIFDRRSKPITITNEGEKIIEQLKVIARELNMLQEVVSDLKGELAGTLRIGAIPTVGPYILPLFLNKFVEQFPNIQFEVSEITTEKIVDHLEKRQLDIGIVSLPLNNPKLEEIPLYEEPFLFYDAQESSYSKAVSIKKIDARRLWLLEEGHCMRVQVEQICKLKKEMTTSKRNLNYKSGTVDTLVKLVDNNKGISFLPQLATLGLSEQQREHLWQIEAPVPVRSVGLLVHRHFVKKKILNLLKTAIQQHIEPYLFSPSDTTQLFSPLEVSNKKSSK
ncbi:MAG: LysR substrate-binding domain-containing protein [Bacteroidota bacterium]